MSKVEVKWVAHTDELIAYVGELGLMRYRTDGTRKHEYFSRGRSITEQSKSSLDAYAVTLCEKAKSFTDAYGDTVYIRWNDLPKSGRSTNWATGQQEKGVSVYAARYNPATDVIEMIENGTDAGAMLGYMFENASAYLVTGEMIGTGSDGEPVLRDAKVIADLAIEEEGLKIK